MLALGTSAVFVDAAVIDRLAAGVSTSLTANGTTGVEVFSAMIWSAMEEITGRSFTALTVTTKMLVARPKLVSITETVMAEVPDWFVVGVTATLRLPPLPPKIIL